jgi:hypothetical protein
VTIERRTEYAVLIGDVVKSRAVRSQQKLLTDLQHAHRWLNERVGAVEPMSLTVGDEFQAVYQHVRSALRAATLLRLHLKRRYDVRFGIGWGEITTVAPERAPLAQSGTGWWRAREAIDEVSSLADKRGWPRSVRIRLRGLDGSLEAIVHAFLLCQDHLLDRMDEKDAAITLGLFEGKRQNDLAQQLEISQSSVSRRQTENGPSVLYRAHMQLTELVP